MATTLTLNTGATIPQVGLGLWKSSAESGVFEAVQTALKEGYVLCNLCHSSEKGIQK